MAFLTVLPIGCTGPDDSPSKQMLDLHLLGLNFLSQHKFEDAEKTLQQLVNEAPSAFVPRFNLAIAQLNQAEKGVKNALLNLQAADRLKPDSARVHYCIGIIERFNGNEEAALSSFQRALHLAARDADCHYQVAIGLLRSGKNSEALPHFEMAVQLDPTIRGAWNNLQLAWRRTGQKEKADEALATFRELESTGRGRAHSTKYTEQGKIAEAIRDWSPARTIGPAPKCKMMEPVLISGAVDGEFPPYSLVDLDLDCIADLWIAGSKPVVYDLTEAPKIIESTLPLHDSTCFAVGDVDEDGIPDLAVSDPSSVKIYRGKEGRNPDFSELISTVDVSCSDLMLADIDMEGDLDLLLAGSRSVSLALNEGRQFRSLADSPSLSSSSTAHTIVAVRDLDGDHDPDLLVNGETLLWIAGAPQWKFEESPADRPLIGSGELKPQSVVLVDLVGDNRSELVALENSRVKIYRRSASSTSEAGKAIFEGSVPVPSEILGQSYSQLAAVDLDLDGQQELLLLNPDRTSILYNSAGVLELSTSTLPGAVNVLAADVDGDGDLDLVFQKQDGSLWLSRNQLEKETNQPHSFRAHLGGRRDGDDRRTNLLGFGARLELRNSNHSVLAFQEGSRGHRSRGLLPVIVGTGSATLLSSLIIDWPDGVLQGEIDVELDRCQQIEEVQRKSSSCPVLFTFDGQSWNFITDFMGGGGLGFWVGPDEYAPPEPTEVVRIAPESLRPVGDRLLLSIMEPMQEICYADRLALLAVDHPGETSCYPEEFFPIQAAPPSGDPMLLQRSSRIFPASIRDASSELAVETILEVDRKYAGPRALVPDHVGYCEDQVWEFSFDEVPTGDQIALFLDGWVEYPYSRINFAAWQGDKRLQAPTFRYRGSDDEPWQLLCQELGYPAGMPKTMVLDVSDIISRGARQIRIESNLELYWDRIFLAPVAAPSPRQIHSIPIHSATMRDGGYPREYSDDGELPATYHYEERDPTLDYRPMERGHVTSYGEVKELLETADDRFVIIGGGDELLIEFDASQLPELPAGWQRTWLLDTFGWCKDLDPLTGARSSVGPLPFRGMSQYPPAADDRAPDRSRYQNQWNTRRD